MRLAPGLACLFALALGCERKLPGPAECRAFAIQTVRALSPARAVPVALLEEQVELLTQECLTTPYDYQTLRCIELTGQPRACVLDLKQRLASARER